MTSWLLFLSWCWVLPHTSWAPEGFFGSVSEKYSEHPWVLYASLLQQTPYLQANNEYHIETTFDANLFDQAWVLAGTWSTIQLKLDLFDTNQITSGITQFHTIDLKTTIDISASEQESTYQIESKVYLFSDLLQQNHYLFIDDVDIDKSGISRELVDLRISLINTQTKKRIKIESSELLDYLQSWRLLELLNNNTTSNRVMEDPEGTIYTSWWKELDFRFQSNWIQTKKALNLIDHKIWLQLESDDSINYTVEGDFGKDIYDWKIAGTLKQEISRESSTSAWEWNLSFPKWLELKFSFRESLSTLSELNKDYKIPKQYISYSSIIEDSFGTEEIGK